MKILIVGFAKIKYMPYLNLYLDNLDKEKNEVHLIYWNRDLKEEKTEQISNVTLHEFKCFQEDEVAKISKIKSFLRFRRWTKEVLKDKFDFIIVLQSVPAILLFDILVSKEFRGKYIYDYRDYTFEKFKVYKYLVGKLVDYSYAAFVSSKGFKKFLPDSEKIKYTHNFLCEDLKCVKDDVPFKTVSEKIRVVFWGFLREEELNLKIIKSFSKDSRFELHYYGREQKSAVNLKNFVSENNISNVFFHGEYNPEDKNSIIKNTDIIHNLYAGENALPALGNKYFDGILFKTPQICMPGSYMGELVDKNKIGVVLNPYSRTFTTDLYNYYQSIDRDIFTENCNKILVQITEEQDNINNFIKAL